MILSKKTQGIFHNVDFFDDSFVPYLFVLIQQGRSQLAVRGSLSNKNVCAPRAILVRIAAANARAGRQRRAAATDYATIRSVSDYGHTHL
jgi:hypothetical protein